MIRANDPAALSARLAEALARHQSGDVAAASAIYAEILAAVPDHPDTLNLSGVAALQLGRTDEAIARLSAAVAKAPGIASFRSNLGNAWRRTGDTRRALEAYDAALQIDPELGEARFGRALSNQSAGNPEAAVADWRELLARNPTNADARNNLGAALLAVGRPAEALAEFDALVGAGRDSADLQRNRALALAALGRDGDVAAAYERALAMRADDVEILRAYAGWLVGRRKFDEAIAIYVRIDALRPGEGRVLNDLGVAWLERGNVDVALDTLKTAAAREPRSAVVRTNLGNALRASGDVAAAIAAYREALALDATIPETYDNLGTAMRDAGRLDEAVASYEAALRLRPDFAAAIGNLANLQLERGDARAAAALYRRAIDADPRAVDPHRNYLLALLYDPEIGPERRMAEHLAFAKRHATATPLAPAVRAPVEGRRIRVGYVSSDFRDHPVARTVGPIVAGHNRACFEVFVYSDVLRPDATTQSMRAAVEHWHDNAGVDDADLARRIRADAIDVLVCVAGRFDRNRPLVAAYRPAPVQLALGEVATTGIGAYDGIFADPFLVPRRGQEAFVERPVRLPHYFVHVPLPGAPEPGPPPSAAGTPPVFGCFNNPVKVGDGVLDLWVRLLKRVEGARLLLKYKNVYAVPSIAARVRAAFVRGGVDPARCELAASLDALDGHLARYDRVDVALDPFPFSGSTATFEALWMGLPVVTLAGAFMAGRWTAAMLATLGHEDWIAKDGEAYVGIAARLAADVELRARLRRTQRARIADSSLCDMQGRTRQIERVYRALVRKVSGGAGR
ncbi:MAG: tetratricopeptide repeat protein [Rhodospirillales bacterium]|nr:tetratricopeptide repeat protein [Rhodospirillales bacterium]